MADTPQRNCCVQHNAKYWLSHIASNGMCGTRDKDDEWIEAKKTHTTFKYLQFPDVAGYYPKNQTELQSPANDPCPPNTYKNIDGECSSGTYVSYYMDYNNDVPPNLYNPLSSTIQITLDGVSQRDYVLRDGTCESMNGSFIISDVADLQARNTQGGSSTSAVTPVNDGDLCYLGAVTFSEGLEGVDSIANAGYTHADFYLMLSGDDPINSAAGVLPSGGYWRGANGATTEDRIYHADEVANKPQVWLIVEFSSRYVPFVIPSGGNYNSPNPAIGRGSNNHSSYYLGNEWHPIYDERFHENNRKIYKSQFFQNWVYGNLLSYGGDIGSNCSIAFAKPIGEYTGDYSIYTSGTPAYHPNATLTSLFPQHDRCDYDKHSEGTFDCLDLDVSLSFTEDDLFAPINKFVYEGHRYGGWGILYYGASGTLDLPCNFNFDVSITSITDDPYINTASNTKQAMPSSHIRSDVVSLCRGGSNYHKIIPGYGFMSAAYYVYDQDDNRPYVLQPYTPGQVYDTFDPDTNALRWYYDDPYVPYGPIASSAIVTMSGAQSLEPIGDPTCLDSQNCENLNTSHRMVYEPENNYSYGTWRAWSEDYYDHNYYMRFDREWENKWSYFRAGQSLSQGDRIACPCGSGLCIDNMHLRVYAHEHTGYDPEIFGSVYSTAIEVDLLTTDNVSRAKYRKVFDNIKWIDYTNWMGSGLTGGVIDPLPISSFANVALDLIESDETYVRDDVNDLPPGDHANGCVLPDTLTVNFEEVTQLDRTRTWDSYWIGVYGVGAIGGIYWDELPRTINLEIPDAWGTSTTVENYDLDKVEAGLTCDVVYSLVGCAITVPPDTYDLYDCDGLASRYQSDLQKVKCAFILNYFGLCIIPVDSYQDRIVRSSMYPYYTYVLTNCSNSDYDGRGGGVNSGKCFNFVGYDGSLLDTTLAEITACGASMDLCCDQSKMPYGTYGLTLQPYDWKVKDLTDDNQYYADTLEPADCNRYDIGWYWVYFEDPCNLFSEQEVPYTYDSTCSWPHAPIPYDDDYTAKGVGCACESHKISLTYYVSSAWYDNVPKIKFVAYIEFLCRDDSTGVYEFKNRHLETGYALTFESDEIPLSEIGLCKGIDGVWVIEKSKVNGIQLTNTNYCPYGGPYFWNKGSTLTLSIE